MIIFSCGKVNLNRNKLTKGEFMFNLFKNKKKDNEQFSHSYKRQKSEIGKAPIKQTGSAKTANVDGKRNDNSGCGSYQSPIFVDSSPSYSGSSKSTGTHGKYESGSHETGEHSSHGDTGSGSSCGGGSCGGGD